MNILSIIVATVKIIIIPITIVIVGILISNRLENKNNWSVKWSEDFFQLFHDFNVAVEDLIYCLFSLSEITKERQLSQQEVKDFNEKINKISSDITRKEFGMRTQLCFAPSLNNRGMTTKENMTEQLISTQKEKFNFDAPSGQIRIAYFILIHRFPEQFKRLFKAIYHPENYYLIHLDKKNSLEIYDDIQNFLANFLNAYMLESENVVWGGYSMVQAELSGIKYLLDINAEWDFFINLSGQDFPLKSQDFIRDFLGKNKGNNFIKIANQAMDRPETMNRIENYFVETDTGFSGVPYKRAYLKDVISYIGGQWKILTRECCEFICNSGEVKKFEDYYLHTLIPDESFFQTVMMNTSFNGKIINDDKRAIIWIPDIGIKLRSKTLTESDTKSLIASGKIKLRPKTLTKDDIDFLLLSDNLFARKFDDNIDANILDIVETNFDLPLTSVKISNVVIVN